MTNPEKLMQQLASVWVDCNVDLLEKHYSHDFQANYYGYAVDYDDLLHRLQYMQQYQRDRRLDIIDVIANGNKLSALCHYFAIDKKDGIIDIDLIVIYHLDQQGKVRRAWAMANKPVDYVQS